ncbi:hypothetical protein DVH05_025507 [Phytophthora capsici]|nr:hypothetical protein DVH05_025507 [Phytophthora capsici]
MVEAMIASEPEAHVPSSSAWEAPPIAKEWHESWESFNQYMEKYQADTHQLFKMRTSTSVSRRNPDIAQAAVDSEPDLIPEGFKTYWIKLICTLCSASKWRLDTPGSTRVPQGTPEPAGVNQGTTGWTGVSEVAEEEAAVADNTPSFHAH